MKSCASCSPAARAGTIAGWLVPSLLLAVMPKCPMCVAAYVAMVTGLGISLPVAAGIKMGLVALCALTLVAMTGLCLKRYLKSRRRRRSNIDAPVPTAPLHLDPTQVCPP